MFENVRRARIQIELIVIIGTVSGFGSFVCKLVKKKGIKKVLNVNSKGNMRWETMSDYMLLV